MRLARLTFALSFVVSISLAARADDGEAKFHRMKRAFVIDRHGFEKPIPAISMLIPSDWEFESDATYPKGMPCGDLVKLEFRAHSKDGRTAIELHPAYLWRWSDDPGLRQQMQGQNQQGMRFGNPGCEVMQPMRAGDFLSRLAAPKLRPGAQVIAVETAPETHEKVMQQVQAQQAQANQAGLKIRYSADDARARLAYDLNGSPEEEWLHAVISVAMQPAPVFARGQMQQAANYQVSARMLFSVRAPKGQLEAAEKLYDLVLSTMQIEGGWQQRIAQVQNNLAAIRRKGEADRAAIRAKGAADVRKIQNEGIQHQQEAQEQQHQAFSQYIRGVETYRDPNSGEKVELDSQYGHAWSNGNGEYILSESPGFNPNAQLNGNWTALEQVKP